MNKLNKIEPYRQLEKDLARWIGCESNQIVVCSSGTAALHLAIEAQRVPINKISHTTNMRKKRKYNIICPNYTMIACPLAISLSGIEPVFVDCNTTSDFCINPELTERIINKDTVGIMAVHVYGRLCDMQVIHDIAKKYALFVIEDMAEAHGCYPHPNTQIACWSFYKNKVVNGEEGGCIYFQSVQQADIARQLRNVGFTNEHNYTHIPRGHNYRMSNLHAQPIIESLQNYEIALLARRKLEEEYDKYCPEQWRLSHRDSPWVYDIRIPGMISEQQQIVIRKLQSHDIPARYGFKPMSVQDQFSECKRLGTANSLRLSEEIILLPLAGNMSMDTPEEAFKIIKSYF